MRATVCVCVSTMNESPITIAAIEIYSRRRCGRDQTAREQIAGALSDRLRAAAAAAPHVLGARRRARAARLARDRDETHVNGVNETEAGRARGPSGGGRRVYKQTRDN